jgi:NAD+ kinase
VRVNMNVLLVYKKSQLRLYQQKKNAHIARLLDEGDESVRPLVRAHEAHERTMLEVKRALRFAKVPFVPMYRASLRPDATVGKLVVTIGGDGTLLDASHRVAGSAVLGVNSDPETSIGFLCMATGATFAQALDDILVGRAHPMSITRLGGEVDGVPFPFPVLNDVLIAHKNPAATCRYILAHGGVREDQKSSGIWCSTATGSTAAMASAGGDVQLLDDARLQLRVREAYAADTDGPQLSSFYLPPGDSCEVVSRMREGCIYLDGPHVRVPFGMGAKLRVYRDPVPLSLYANAAMAERRELVKVKLRRRRRDDETTRKTARTA